MASRSTPMTLSLPRLLVCFLLALALLPATAQADIGFPRCRCRPPTRSRAPPTPSPSPAGASTRAAARSAVTWAHMGAGINARSQWMSYDIHNPATYSQCSITYNLDVDWDWPKLCTVIEHELGHLAGHEHVDDPHDVMSPYYVYPTPECAAGAPAPAAAPAPVTTAEAPAVAPTPNKATSKKATTKKKPPSARSPSARRRPAARRPRPARPAPRSPAPAAAAFARRRPAGPSSRTRSPLAHFPRLVRARSDCCGHGGWICRRSQDVLLGVGERVELRCRGGCRSDLGLGRR